MRRRNKHNEKRTCGRTTTRGQAQILTYPERAEVGKPFELKDFCGSYGFTQETLTRLTGFSPRAVANWTSGQEPSESSKRRLNEIISKHTGQTVEKVTRDSERNFYLSAEEAKGYGIIDEVIVSRELAQVPQVAGVS